MTTIGTVVVTVLAFTPVDTLDPGRMYQLTLAGAAVTAIGWAVTFGGRTGRTVVTVGAYVTLVGIFNGQPVTGTLLVTGGAAAGCWWATALTTADSRQRRVLLLPLIAAGLIVATEATTRTNWYSNMFATVTGSVPRWDPGEGFRARGITGHPLPTATILTVTLIAAAATVRTRGKLLATIVGTFGVAAATGTRTALLGVAAVAAVSFVSNDPTWRARARKLTTVGTWTLISVAATVTLIGAVRGDQLTNVPRMLDVTDLRNDTSYTHRTGTISTTINTVASSDPVRILIGHGKGALGEAARTQHLFGTGPNTADNTFLTVMYDYGLIGAAAAVAAAGWAVRAARTASRATRPAIYAAVTVASFAVTFDTIHWTSVCATIAAAATICAHNHHNPDLEPVQPPARTTTPEPGSEHGIRWERTGTGSGPEFTDGLFG